MRNQDAAAASKPVVEGQDPSAPPKVKSEKECTYSMTVSAQYAIATPAYLD